MKKIIMVLIIIFLFGSVSAVKNPSAVYCEEMGYEFSVNSVGGNDIGMCKLPDGTFVAAWEFLKGKVGKEYSYCEKQGYVLKTINNSEKCSSIFSEQCAVCVIELKEGKITGLASLSSDEVEVTRLMNLSFDETTCGDGVCVSLEENYGSCSEDCASGLEDNYCDRVEDGICDPDCIKGEDPDCLDVIEPETKCSYDGICPLECIGTNDIDCLCVDPESEECKSSLVKLKDPFSNFDKKTQEDKTKSNFFSKGDKSLILFLIVVLAILILGFFILVILDLVKPKKKMFNYLSGKAEEYKNRIFIWFNIN